MVLVTTGKPKGWYTLCILLALTLIQLNCPVSVCAQNSINISSQVLPELVQEYEALINLTHREAVESKAFERIEELREKKHAIAKTKADHLFIDLMYAHVLQVSKDEHQRPIRQLQNILDEINAHQLDIPILEYHVYRRMVFSSLLVNQIDSAIAHAKKAWQGGKDIYGEDTCQRIDDYYNLGYALIEGGQDSLALPIVERTLFIAENYCGLQSEGAIDAYRLMGRYYIKSNYQASKAIPYLQKALRISMNTGDDIRAYNCLYYLSRTYVFTDKLEDAESIIPLFDTLRSVSDELTGFKCLIAKLDIEYEIAKKHNDLEQAIQLKKQFAQVIQEHLPERKSAILASYYSLLEMAVQINRPEKVQEYLDDLVEIKQEYTMHPDQEMAYYQALSHGNRFLMARDSAIKASHAGLTLIGIPDSTSALHRQSINQVRDRYYFRQYLLTFSHFHTHAYETTGDTSQLKKALEYNRQIVAISTHMIEEDDERIARQSPEEIASDFEHLIWTNIEMHRHTQDEKYLEDAFLYTDMASGLTFFRGKNQWLATTRSTYGDSLIRIRKALLDDLSRIRVSQVHGDSTVKHLAQQEIEIQLLIHQTNLLLQKNEPLYMSDIRSIQLGQLNQLQENVLDKNSAFIHYYYHNQLHAFVVLEDNIIYVPLSVPDTFSNLIDQHQRLLSNPSSELEEFIRINRILSKILIDPVIEQLPGDIERLHISPYGQLGKIPFECLLQTDVSEPTEFGRLPYLIKSYAVSYSSSMSALMDMKQSPNTRYRQQFLAVVPEYSRQLLDSSRSADQASPTRALYVPLSGARKEAQSISSMIRDSEVLMKDKATEHMTKQRMENHSIWHFAMHAVLNEEDPMLTALYFPDGDEKDDGYLTAGELYEMRLTADLVVLAACNTGVGTFDYLSGSMSLARAFLFSGSRSVVLSNWPAPDDASARFMPAFYKQLLRKQPKDVALQKAKINWLQTTGSDAYKHPYYWNTFSLWGASDPIDQLVASNRLNPFSWFILLSGLILVFGLWLFKHRKHRPTA